MKAATVLALVASVSASYAPYVAPVSSSAPAPVSSTKKPYYAASSSTPASPIKPSKPTWGDDEDCDEDGAWPASTPAAPVVVKPSYGGTWKADSKPTVNACAPYATTKTVTSTKTGEESYVTVTSTIPGGVATYTKDGKVFVTTLPGKTSTYLTTIPGAVVTVTKTVEGGVATYTKDGKVYTTTIAGAKTTLTKDVVFTATSTITTTVAGGVATYTKTLDGKTVTVTTTLENGVATFTKTVTGTTCTTITTAADPVVTYTSTSDPTVKTVTTTLPGSVVVYTKTVAGALETVTKAVISTITPAGCGATPPAAPVSPPAAPVAPGKPEGGAWSPVAPAGGYTPVKPVATTSKVYSPVLATANAAAQNGMAGAALIAAAAWLI